MMDELYAQQDKAQNKVQTATLALQQRVEHLRNEFLSAQASIIRGAEHLSHLSNPYSQVEVFSL